jgi:hypothetical protein
MVIDFLLVQSKPGAKTGERQGLAELKQVIARVASKGPRRNNFLIQGATVDPMV